MKNWHRRARLRVHTGGGLDPSLSVLMLALSAGLMVACTGISESTTNTRRTVASEKSLSYFVASPKEERRPNQKVLSSFRTLSGASFEVWRERKATRKIRFDEFYSLRIREELTPPSFSAPTFYVVAEAELRGEVARRFDVFLEEERSAYLWVATPTGEAIDFLPVEYALRPEGAAETRSLWLSVGRFRNRDAAQKFFGDLGGIRRTYIALDDAERSKALAENEQLVEFAIWKSICDLEMLAEWGAELKERLPTIPGYAERVRKVDCLSPPALGDTGGPAPILEKLGPPE